MILEDPKKLVDKANKELIELHKRVLLNYLMSKGVDYRTRNKFYALYDYYIKPKNIQKYFWAPCNLFIKALVRDELYKIKGLHVILKKKKEEKDIYEDI